VTDCESGIGNRLYSGWLAGRIGLGATGKRSQVQG
jgi:hypothetical protein